MSTDRSTATGPAPSRVVIEAVTPEIDCARFPAKAVVGDAAAVEAAVYTDGHDVLACTVLHRPEAAAGWAEEPMVPLGNDRWRAEFALPRLGRHRFTVQAWIDRFATWQHDLTKKEQAGQDLHVDLLTGADLARAAAARAAEDDPAGPEGADARALHDLAERLADEEAPPAGRFRLALDDRLTALMYVHGDRSGGTVYERELAFVVDPPRARFSTWYELFPRSAAAAPGRHGTFADVEARLDDLAAMGFDVLYLPPIHPIGHTHRKGKNNTPAALPGDVGSPWGIGSEDGGHKAIHPDLGTLDDFRHLVDAARSKGMEVALDVAFQCSPDHPYVKEHPEWFRHRPDGTIQYAENPPKKYQDIYPFNFECDDWRGLWEELKSIFEFWIDQGVQTFRVDNPHTKPLPFWEWCIGELKREHPELIFLSEAFTRPHVMDALAKLGFTQSYTYFTWRNAKWEIEKYFTELTQRDPRHFFRPNAWPNTPDILTEYLQTGGRPAFVTRLVLAATLTANYGMYGPAFELMEAEPIEPGSEEYRNSEKYEIRHWDLDGPGNLREVIARVNRIRHEHPALQRDDTLRFHPVDSDQIVAYSKTSPDGRDVVVVVANVDPHHAHAGWVHLDLDVFGLDDRAFQVHDLLGGGRFLWQGAANYVELDPHVLPAHVFALRRHVRTERDFDYFFG